MQIEVFVLLVPQYYPLIKKIIVKDDVIIFLYTVRL
jgi:hypothetical protein